MDGLYWKTLFLYEMDDLGGFPLFLENTPIGIFFILQNRSIQGPIFSDSHSMEFPCLPEMPKEPPKSFTFNGNIINI